MFVSVLLSAFNAEKTIAEAIESILSQTHRDFELLLINDGSTDGTLLIMQKFADQDHRIKIISHQNMGMGASLNQALHLANAEWVVKMDADDIMLPQRLERQIAFIKKHPDIVVASCLVYYVDEYGRVIGKNSSDLRTREDLIRYLKSNELIGFHHSGVIMKKEVIISVGGYRPRFWPADDIDLWNRVAERGYLILVQPEYLVKYRIHASSISVSNVRMARLKLRWVRECMICRRTGLPEPSLEEFLRIERNRPWWIRLNHWRKDLAKVFYKRAVCYFSKHQYHRIIAPFIGSLLLQPSYTAKQVLSKFIAFALHIR